jgi:cytoskeletal protein RodZ
MPEYCTAFGRAAAIRQARGITLKEISRETKIGTRYLEAIEHADFEQLPGGVYNSSYIRQYAAAIPVDDRELLESYRREFAEQDVENPPPPARTNPTWLRHLNAVLEAIPFGRHSEQRS